MKLFSALVLTLVSALCSVSLPAAEPSATTPTAAKAQDYTSAQQFVQIVEWGSSGGRRYTLADTEVIIEQADTAAAPNTDPFATGKKQSVKIEPAAAAAAWEKIGQLGILKWRSAYDPRDLGQEDGGGTEWTVDLRLGKDKKRSVGVNAFPGLKPLGMPELGSGGIGPDPQSAYSSLVSIVTSLAAPAH